LQKTENNIGDEGAKALAELLKTNTTLVKLCLPTNKIGDEGARMMCESLKINTTLTRLVADNNNIGDAMKEELRRAWGSRDEKELFLDD